MQQIYASVTKVLVESRQGSLMYLPLDRILQQASGGASAGAAVEAAPSTGSSGSASSPPSSGSSGDSRTRDNARSRERETR